MVILLPNFFPYREGVTPIQHLAASAGDSLLLRPLHAVTQSPTHPSLRTHAHRDATIAHLEPICCSVHNHWSTPQTNNLRRACQTAWHTRVTEARTQKSFHIKSGMTKLSARAFSLVCGLRPKEGACTQSYDVTRKETLS